VCDAKDNDCNGKVDDGAPDGATWYADGDGDGYGRTGATTKACTKPAGYAAQGGDCDDQSASINPGAAEKCNGIDDNCDAVIDTDSVDKKTWYLDGDGDGYGRAANPTVSCTSPGAYYVTTGGDCNDADAKVHPGATEVCNNVDDDCNGTIDQNAADAKTWYQDKDKDGYGDPDFTTVSCAGPSGYTGTPYDCDDGNASIYPGLVSCPWDFGGKRCLEVLNAGDSHGSGYYYIDPDGTGPVEELIAYCDMKTGGGGWTRLYYQSSTDGQFFPVGQFELNRDKPDSVRYAILEELELFRRDAGFEFMMDWPGSSFTSPQVWYQTNNPVTDAAGAMPTGYKAISAPYSYNGWGGLQRSYYGQYSLLDGTLNPLGNWYYAVGTTYAWNPVPTAQPGPTGGVAIAELWVR
jgi:hypothetical protein